MSGPHGHLVINPSNPQASAECQRCGFYFNLNTLQWQYEWAGNTLLNTNLLFCQPCLDDPQPQLMARIVRPDPLPKINARPPSSKIEEEDIRVTSDNKTRITQDSNTRILGNGIA